MNRMRTAIEAFVARRQARIATGRGRRVVTSPGRRGVRVLRSVTSGGRWGQAAALLALAGLFAVGLQALPAQAAGPGVLSITPVIVNPTTGATMATVDPLAVTRYRVDYSFTCSVASCDNTTVTVAPNPRDPYYNQFILEQAGYTFTPPFPGATATGSPAAGITVNLGNLANGFSGVFQIYYTVQNRPGLPAPGSPGSFFPNGWTIPASATIQSPTAVGPATGSTSATWVSRTQVPGHAISGPSSTRTDTPISIGIGATSGCNYFSQYNYGNEQYQCAKSWTITSQLPTDAQYVAGSASGGGVYNATTRTITWTGADTTVATTNARGALGRSYQVTFPSSGMPTTGAGCIVAESFTSNFSLVLLDGTVQNAPTRTATVQAQNCDPFSGMTTPNKSSTFHAGNVTNPIVNIPATGQPANGRNWTVSVGNTANVAGVATFTDTALDQPDMPVYQIYNPGTPTLTVDYTRMDSGGATVTGTVTLASLQSYIAPAGWRIVSVTATSAPLTGPNPSSASQTNNTPASIAFYYAVSAGATPGTRTNTATVTMSYPGYSLTPLTANASRTVTLQNTPPPSTTPNMGITIAGPSVVGGGNIVAGSNVGWGVVGSITNAPTNTSTVPQYVFIAPYGWNILTTAWSVAPPAGTTVVQRQVTIAGQLRNVVVATWPAPITIPASGTAATLPMLYVNASPTTAAPAGTNTATMLVGDANRGTFNFSSPYTEPVDLAGDGTTGDVYTRATSNATLTGTPALTVTKEICRPDGSGGCIWIADPNVIVGVEPTATSITYRITITNSGTAQANNVVAYDVLPYIGDAGLTDTSSAVPRGSTVQETLNSVSGVPGDVTVDYSTSTNPPRPGVYTGTTTGDWLAPAAGASALRATITALPAGASRTFTYDAALSGGSADNIACNSVAGIATSLSAVEPSAVCATTQEADLSVARAARFPLQVGRVGTVPFVVNNGGGSQLATGTVTIDIPAGISINSLAIANWNCTSPSMTGPTTVTCDPVDGGGASRSLQMNVPETIALQVTPDASVNGDDLCFATSVSGIMSDPVTGNNATTVCSTVFDAASLLSVSKTDGVTSAAVGDTLTYTITATNLIVDQGLTSMVVTDSLPANVEWVSGGTVSGQDADGLGGTVTFPATGLTSAGSSTLTGDVGTGNAGSSAQFTVTVRVAAAATGSIVNNTTATATDPLTASPLTATSSDTDQLQRLTVTKGSNAAPAGVRTGDTVTYTVILTNDGTADYTTSNPARVVDDLTGVLDDATYVSGSVSVNGGSASAIAPNGSQHLVWSGALTAGSTATIVYSITVGNGGNKVVTNTAYAASTVGASCTNGLDQRDLSCATVQSIFAPLIGKRIQSFTQNNDGTWTIVYAVDVTNPSPVGTSTYSLSDTLKFGAGIQVTSASAGMPAGVTAATPAWSGSGALATGVSIPGGAQHTYLVTVIANAQQVASTTAAACVANATGGFANQATLSLVGLADASAEVCASPVKPTITKTVGAAVQQANGSWNVVYTVTVRNSNASPASLTYTVQDALSFPTGTVINSVVATGPGASGSFNGVGNQALLSGVGSIPAPTGGATSTTRVYTVTVNVDAPVGAVSAADLLCAPTGGGYANAATLFAGTSTNNLGSASACAPITVAPLPEITKSVVSSVIDGGGDWTIVYQIDVKNPDGTFSTFYDLDDQLEFGAGSSVSSATVTTAPTGVTPEAWDGGTATAIALDVPLAAGQTHTYQVTVVVDPGTLDASTFAADCRVDAGEGGNTGFRNTATVTAGVSTAFDEACEPFSDPSVVKTTVGAPTQNSTTGIWTLAYQLTVTNRSAGPAAYTLDDTLGLPSDVTIVDVAASGPAGTVNSGFDGVTDTDLASGTIAAAADPATPTTQVFTVTVQFTVPAGMTSGVQCDPAQGPGGLRNEVEIGVGARVTGSVACADVPDVPTPTLSKTVLSQEQQADGTWLVLYRITVANPSGTSASEYTLEDEFALGTGIALVGTPTITTKPAGVTTDPTWDGDAATTIAEEILLPAAGSHTYTVRAVIDSGTVSEGDPAGDCVIDAGETGTGFGNTASIGTGIATAEVDVCAQAWDPGVTKEIDGVPTRQADGSWLLSYVITVTNPSAVALSYGLVDELDFPAGTVITVESAAGRSGSPTVEANWDGQTQLQLVADGTPLPPNALHEFEVTVRALLPAGQASQSGGWGNSATVESGVGGVITSQEEELVDILLPELTITKTATPSQSVLRIGDTVGYEIEIENVGAGDFTTLYPAVVWDDLTDVLDDATLSAAPTATPATGVVTSSATGFNWRGALLSGATLTLQYTVTVANGGDANLQNTAFVALPDEVAPVAPVGTACVAPVCEATATAMPALLVEKRVAEIMTAPGSVVHYTVTVTNTSLVDIPAGSPAIVTDDLSNVLAYAAYAGDVAADRGTASVAASTLTWTGGLTAGETATVTYSVNVNANAPIGAQLVNVALSDPMLATLSRAGGPAPAQATTTTAIGLLALTGVESLWAAIAAIALLVFGLLAMMLPRSRRRRADA